MVLAAVVNAAEIAAGDNTAAEASRISDSPCMLWQSSFWCWAIGVLGQGPQEARCFRRLRCGATGAVVGIVASWGLVRAVSGITSAGRAVAYAANRVVSSSICSPAGPRLPQHPIFGLFGAFALIGLRSSCSSPAR